MSSYDLMQFRHKNSMFVDETASQKSNMDFFCNFQIKKM